MDWVRKSCLLEALQTWRLYFQKT